jgi:hypothetical protein
MFQLHFKAIFLVTNKRHSREGGNLLEVSNYIEIPAFAGMTCEDKLMK